MADISKLEQQADLLFNNVAGWENSTLQRIGKRIKKYGKLSLADVKSINNIATVKQDMDAITKELAKVTGYNISQIEQMYGELLEEQHLANQPLYDYRGKTFVPFAENRELQAIARAYAKTTGETMINLAKTSMLRTRNAKGRFVNMQKGYVEILDRAVMQVASGATDFHTAMRESIIQLGGGGVQVEYASGVSRRLDTVVRQNLLWGAKQASIAYNEKIGKDLECDGIEIDWHSNPRPSHEVMQGKQYSIVGERTINGVTYEDAYEQGIDSKDGESGLLNDYGCLHYKTPIILGISEPRYSPEELKRLNEQNAKRYTIDGKEYSGYEITQMQRRLESSVRNEKTTRDLAKASGDNALVKRCTERIKAYQGKYNEISEITDIQGDKKRMSVPRGATVKGATPTQKQIIKPQIKDDLIKNGFSEESAEKIQKNLENLEGREREQWEKAFKIKKYSIEDENTSTHFDADTGEIHLAKGESSNIVVHETAHSISPDSVKYTVDKGRSWEYDITHASSLTEHLCGSKGKSADIETFCKKIGVKSEDGWFASPDSDIFEKTIEFSRKYRDNDGYECVSDILSGLSEDKTGGSIIGGGHSKEYWYRPFSGGRSEMYYEEAWADYCTLRFTKNKEMLDLLDEVTPNLSKALNSVYEEVFLK